MGGGAGKRNSQEHRGQTAVQSAVVDADRAIIYVGNNWGMRVATSIHSLYGLAPLQATLEGAVNDVQLLLAGQAVEMHRVAAHAQRQLQGQRSAHSGWCSARLSVQGRWHELGRQVHCLDRERQPAPRCDVLSSIALDAGTDTPTHPPAGTFRGAPSHRPASRG